MSRAHPSPLTLDLRWLNALSPDEAKQVEEHLSGCATCRAQVDRDDDDRRRFATRAQLRRRRRPVWAIALAPVLAVAAVLLLWMKLRGPAIAIKGGPTFATYARHAGRIAQVRDGETLHPGDEIRFVVVPADYPRVMVASIDAAGRASVYFPFDGAASGEVASPRVELPGSVILDETLGPERIFALFSREPLAAAEVTRALRQIGAGGPEAIRGTRDLAAGADASLTLLLEKAP